MEDNLTRSFGIIYEVTRNSGQGGPPVSERLVPDTLIELDHKSRTVSLRLDAFGESALNKTEGVKGNTITITLPLDGLELILETFKCEQLKRSLRASYGQ